MPGPTEPGLRAWALGPSMLYGQGAGAMPTGSAVVSDIIDLTRNILAGSPGRVPLPPEKPVVGGAVAAWVQPALGCPP